MIRADEIFHHASQLIPPDNVWKREPIKLNHETRGAIELDGLTWRGAGLVVWQDVLACVHLSTKILLLGIDTTPNRALGLARQVCGAVDWRFVDPRDEGSAGPAAYVKLFAIRKANPDVEFVTWWQPVSGGPSPEQLKQ